MPSPKKRLIIYVSQAHIDALKTEHERTGVPVTEIVRRLILPPARKVADYQPPIERRDQPVLI
jgi:hypothetical protein